MNTHGIGRIAVASFAVAASGLLIATNETTPAYAATTEQSLQPELSLEVKLAHLHETRYAVGERVQVDDLRLESESVDLELARFESLTGKAPIVVDGENGPRELERSDLKLYRGSVAGEPDSEVFLAVSSRATNGFFIRPETADREASLQFLSTGKHADAVRNNFAVAVTNARDLQAPAAPFCHAIDPDPVDARRLGNMARSGEPPCRVITVAVDTDYEFTQNLFGGDEIAAGDYVQTLFGAISMIYERDFNVRVAVPYVRLWESNTDPYESDNTLGALNEIRSHWISTQGGVDRELAHFLSGKDLGGGRAWVGVVCDADLGYAVSGNLNGFFPLPVQDNNGANWDFMVTAHEMGHNVGSGHTHSAYTPPIDGCGNGDCTQAANGTIMSYCHQCNGGLSNIRLGFHPVVINRVLQYLDSTCDLTATGANAIDDVYGVLPDQAVNLIVGENDNLASCVPVSIDSFDAVSAAGGTVTEWLFNPVATLRYTPPSGYAGPDSFAYTVEGGSSATVTIDVLNLRAPDAVGLTTPGIEAAYYDLVDPEVLPNFDALTSFGGDVLDQINFASTNGNFATTGRSDDFGVVFEGIVDVPTSGVWTFYTNSDDGSRLFIGEEMIVDNDGLHGMQEQSGTIGLQAGTHRVRVEFFERGGGAGLIVSYEGPSTAKQPIPSADWSHSEPAPPCPADIAEGDGVVDTFDLLALLDQWGDCDGDCPPSCAADISGAAGASDCTVDTFDLLSLLDAWGGCE